MEQIEENVAHSFMKVKADIIRLQDEFMQLRETQIRISNRLAKLETKKPNRKRRNNPCMYGHARK